MIDFAIEKLDKIGEKDAACAVGDLHFDLRRTKRALWLARAERAAAKVKITEIFNGASLQETPWQWVERKCREKAEEYNV